MAHSLLIRRVRKDSAKRGGSATARPAQRRVHKLATDNRHHTQAVGFACGERKSY